MVCPTQHLKVGSLLPADIKCHSCPWEEWVVIFNGGSWDFLSQSSLSSCYIIHRAVSKHLANIHLRLQTHWWVENGLFSGKARLLLRMMGVPWRLHRCIALSSEPWKDLKDFHFWDFLQHFFLIFIDYLCKFSAHDLRERLAGLFWNIIGQMLTK